MIEQPIPSASPSAARRRAWPPFVVAEPSALLPWLAASTSIGTLLLYLLGIVELRLGGAALLLPGVVLLILCHQWALRRAKTELVQRIEDGCWAGLVATFLYDMVRVPIAMSGVPVFKAISYFGTVFLAQPAPTIASDCVGWLYHLSNGIGFGLMYVLWVARPRWWSAVLWGLILEGVMLLTPYAEVFGYKISRQFLSITIGAHVVYGLGLWGGLQLRALRPRTMEDRRRVQRGTLGLGAGVLLGLAGIATHFHLRYARAIPPSPPEYIGPHLYTTWNVLEPDRVCSLWIWQRFVDRQARFHFVPPFSRIERGIPFDVPEAEIRRTGTRSATEILLERARLGSEQPLSLLGRVTHQAEITPWMAPADAELEQLQRQLQGELGRANGSEPRAALPKLSTWLDTWYASAAGTNVSIKSAPTPATKR